MSDLICEVTLSAPLTVEVTLSAPLTVEVTMQGVGATSDLLSTTHNDTLAASVIRGDILYGNATPKWARLPIGVSGTILTSNGVDVSWQSPTAAMIYPGTGIAVSSGTGWSTSLTDNSTNWNTAYSDRLKWDGGSADLVAATGRTSLGLGTAAVENVGYFATAIHNLINTTNHPVTGLTGGHFLKALTGTTYGFAAHGLGFADVGAAASNHDHSGTYEPHDDDLTAIAALGFASVSFLTKTATNTWSLDTNTYSLSNHAHAGTYLPVSGAGDIYTHNASEFLTSVTAHNLLSTTHGDTLADSIVRGDIMYGNSTPKWARLPFPATPTGKIIQATATDVAWSSNPLTIGVSASVSGSNTGDQTLSGLGAQAQLNGTGFVKATGTTISYDNSTYLTSVTAHNLLSATHGDTTTGACVRGDIITGQGISPTWTKLAIGTTGKALVSDGTDVGWSTSALGTAAYTASTAYEVPLTFGSGVTRAVNAVSNDLITGKAGGQTILGGTGASENLIISAGSHSTIGSVNIGTIAKGENLNIQANEGAELAPALTGNSGTNWTLSNTTGYVQPFNSSIDKTGDGTGTITTTAATTIVTGTTYKVVIVVSAISGSTATYTIGGSSGTTLAAATTYIDYITASTTGKIIITPIATALRITITLISIKALTDATGDLSVYGNLNVYSGTTFHENINISKTSSNKKGVIYKGVDPFIHAFSHPTGNTAIPIGLNVFIGSYSGNFTLGSIATSTGHASYNMGIGAYSLSSLRNGSQNVAVGYLAGQAIRDGNSNTSIGHQAGYAIRDGLSNISIGGNSNFTILDGGYNVAIGVGALQGADAAINGSVAIGYRSLYSSALSYNIGIGYYAGYYETDGQKIIIDNINRTSEALGRTSALIYGVTHATVTNQILVLGGGGNVGIGIISPTARFHLPAGTATAGTAALKFTPATSVLLTAPEIGAFEPVTDDISYTINTGTARKQLVMTDGTLLVSTRVPYCGTNGRLLSDAGMTYDVTTGLSLSKALKTTGGRIKNGVVITDIYQVLVTDETVFCNKAIGFTVTLPVAAVGQVINIKNIGVGTVTVVGNPGTDLIDGVTSQTLITWDSITVQCYIANNWCII
jgi:hypothetical protein